MALLTMSEHELNRLKIIEDINEQRLSVVQGAELVRISRRQMTRLVRSYRLHCASGLISKKRGSPSNRRYTDGFRDYVLALIKQHYPDFGPTFALEKLEDDHGVSLSKETLRKWMIEAGIWKSRKELRKRVYQPRNRRECFSGCCISLGVPDDLL